MTVISKSEFDFVEVTCPIYSRPWVGHVPEQVTIRAAPVVKAALVTAGFSTGSHSTAEATACL